MLKTGWALILVVTPTVANPSFPPTLVGTLDVLKRAAASTKRFLEPEMSTPGFSITENPTWPLLLGTRLPKSGTEPAFHKIVLAKLSKNPPPESRVEKSNIAPFKLTVSSKPSKLKFELF